MNFNLNEYLPDSEKRLKHLRRIINGRPVAILAAGPSIKELEERVDELRHTDICYFGMNWFFVQENHILQRIGKRFSVIIEGANETLPPIFDKVINYLNRDDDNLLVSSFYQSNFNALGPGFNLQSFLNKYDAKLLFPYASSDRTVPDSEHPLHFLKGNHLSWLIYLAIVGKASKIILFGADGYPKNDKERYYRPQEYEQGPLEILINNTNKGFNPIISISLKNIYKTYGHEPIPILNCSEVSFYTPFPKVSYDDAFAFLLGSKNAKDIPDLRTPTASIIIPSNANDKVALQKTLESIGEQSYSNYETTVVQRSSDFLDTMEKALPLAKGRYIFYCPAGDTYPNTDWVNSCLEILENRPQISLVCGMPEDQLADSPWRKKMFLYYWLKRKNFFTPSTLCVRKQVLEKYLFQTDKNQTSHTEFEGWLNFNLNFNMAGYLPAFIPTTVSHHNDKNTGSESLGVYRHKIDDYKRRLVFKKTSHHFRDGDGNILPGKFYLSVFLFYGLAKNLNDKLPNSLRSCSSIIKRLIRKLYPK